MNWRVVMVASFTALSVLAGCGGGGTSVVPSAPGRAKSAATSATMRVTIPPRSRSTAQYVSASTQSIVLSTSTATLGTFNTGPTSNGCGPVNGATVCQFTFNATVGPQTIAVKSYDGPNGTGNLLSSGSVTQNLVAGTNVIPVVLSGVVQTISASVVTTIAGTAANVPVIVMAKDPDGNVIVGPGSYASPITLTDGDTSGTTTLSVNGGAASTSVHVVSPSDTVTLHYNGANIAKATLSPSAAGVSAASNAIFAPTPVVASSYRFPANAVDGSPQAPLYLVIGGDGNVWATASHFSTIMKIAPSGTMTEFDPGVAPSTNLRRLDVTRLAGAPLGSSIAVWGAYSFPGTNPFLFSMTTAGTVTNYSMPSGSCNTTGAADALAADGSGGAWFAVDCSSGVGFQIGHITSSGTLTLSQTLTGMNVVNNMLVGKDGNLYLAGKDAATGFGAVIQAVLSGTNVTATHQLTAAASSGPYGWFAITQSADGDLWLGNSYSNPPLVGRIHFMPGAFAAGTASSFDLSQGQAFPFALTGLPDGTVWVPSSSYPTITELIPNGQSAPTQINFALPSPPNVYGMDTLAILGPDGYLWVSDYDFNQAPAASGEIERIAY